jgi:hypothetical protein
VKQKNKKKNFGLGLFFVAFVRAEQFVSFVVNGCFFSPEECIQVFSHKTGIR